MSTSNLLCLYKNKRRINQDLRIGKSVTLKALYCNVNCRKRFGKLKKTLTSGQTTTKFTNWTGLATAVEAALATRPMSTATSHYSPVETINSSHKHPATSRQLSLKQSIIATKHLSKGPSAMSLPCLHSGCILPVIAPSLPTTSSPLPQLMRDQTTTTCANDSIRATVLSNHLPQYMTPESEPLLLCPWLQERRP